MKKLICIITGFFLLSILDVYSFRTLPSKQFLGLPTTVISITAFLQTILQMVLIATVFVWTSNKKLTFCAGLLYLANLEDCFYFIIDIALGGFVPTNLFWMPQYHIFGFWNISHQIIWSIVLLSLAILVYLARAGETKAQISSI